MAAIPAAIEHRIEHPFGEYHMSTHSRLLASLVLSLAVIATACKEKGSAGALSQDTALSRDLALANRDSGAQPELKDVPPAPPPAAQPEPERPARSTPRPRPRTRPPSTSTPPRSTVTPSGNTETRTARGSEPSLATVPAGSVISLTSNDRVCTNTNKVGDRFTATVTNAVAGSNGAVIPAGAKAVLEVTELKRSENATDPIKMTFAVLNLSWNGKAYPVNASIDQVDVEKVRNSSKGNDAKKVVGGAVVGAILGQVIGHNTKSTVIGAATGAAAGTAVAMGTANYEGCVPSGGNIRIKLNEPATVPVQ
jgi:hypothetical protein